jgi:hypothetical protein
LQQNQQNTSQITVQTITSIDQESSYGGQDTPNLQQYHENIVHQTLIPQTNFTTTDPITEKIQDGIIDFLSNKSTTTFRFKAD